MGFEKYNYFFIIIIFFLWNIMWFEEPWKMVFHCRMKFHMFLSIGKKEREKVKKIDEKQDRNHVTPEQKENFHSVKVKYKKFFYWTFLSNFIQDKHYLFEKPNIALKWYLFRFFFSFIFFCFVPFNFLASHISAFLLCAILTTVLNFTWSHSGGKLHHTNQPGL